MKFLLTTLALAGALLTVPAHAGRCPNDMAQIDAALEGDVNISASQLARVNKLREEGAQLHNSGNHTQSLKALAEVMAILGIQ